MRINVWVFGGVLMAALILSLEIGRAGLIDYERLNKFRARQAAQQAADQKFAEENMPQWMRSEPSVQTAAEKKYDVNRDGKLQLAEAKIFLRDTLDVIEEKGGLTINSDILKEYDRNRDGVISKYEAAKIKEIVR